MGRGRPRGWGGSGPTGKRPLRASRDTLDAPDASGACKKAMEGTQRLYAALGAKQRICRKKGRTGRGERRAGREKRRPRRKSRQNRRRPPGPAEGRATGGPEGLKARGQPRRQRRRPARKPPERGPRPGEKEPAQTGRGRPARTPAPPLAWAGVKKTGGAAGRKRKCGNRGGKTAREPARAPGAIHVRRPA